MPRYIETESRTETVVAAINEVLARDGIGGLSLRAIARESRVSTSSLLHHFGNREHLLRVAASQTGRWRVREIDRRCSRDGALAFLPQDADDVVDARAWLAWLELWRSEDNLATPIGGARRDERALLAEIFDYRLARDELDAAIALIDGLMTALCAPALPMPIARARAMLLAGIGSDAGSRALRQPGAGGLDEVRNRSRRWRDRAEP
ncbi:MAG TPA: helix-turn-helix domain-containing protein [Marmoricola sp.]